MRFSSIVTMVASLPSLLGVDGHAHHAHHHRSLKQGSESRKGCGSSGGTLAGKSNAESAPANQAYFEAVSAKKLAIAKACKESGDCRVLPEAKFEIPATWHVVDSPEVTDEHIQENMRVLNRAFNGETRSDNLENIGALPAAFDSVFGNAKISFTTKEIKRVNPGNSMGPDNEEALQNASPPSDQLTNMNIYVTPVRDGEALGWAYMPNQGSLNPVDGVYMNAKTIGGPNKFPANSLGYNGGATLVHEVGHYLDLDHIFNDGCAGDGDGVADTPPTTENAQCPAYPLKNCNGEAAMTMNFMDYTDDSCMNMFTAQQVLRMRLVLERDECGPPNFTNNPCGQRKDLGVQQVGPPTNPTFQPTRQPTKEPTTAPPTTKTPTKAPTTQQPTNVGETPEPTPEATNEPASDDTTEFPMGSFGSSDDPMGSFGSDDPTEFDTSEPVFRTLKPEAATAGESVTTVFETNNTVPTVLFVVAIVLALIALIVACTKKR